MDYNATKAFIAVVQAGSFLNASQKAQIPISTLSRKVTELEQQLGVQLLERSKQGVKLTHKGQTFFEQAVMGMELLEQASRSVQATHTLAGKIRLSIPPNFSLWWDLLIDFQKAYPDIQVFCHSSDRLVDLFEDSIDVALRMREIHTDKVVSKPIKTLNTVFVASPDLFEHQDKPTTINQLFQLPIAEWANVNDRHFTWQKGKEKIRYEPNYSTNDVQAILHYVRQSMGIALLPEYLVSDDLKTGKLIQLLPDEPTPIIPLFLIYAHHRYPSAIVRAYLDFCENWISSHYHIK
ncbi:LysR family transcriptional regulator [Pasteurellaceae bacterium LFhippo2]|nr:LysR family transcriptional regulator [Pasteurellaceae bacterium LFhippo2]